MLTLDKFSQLSGQLGGTCLQDPHAAEVNPNPLGPIKIIGLPPLTWISVVTLSGLPWLGPGLFYVFLQFPPNTSTPVSSSLWNYSNPPAMNISNCLEDLFIVYKKSRFQCNGSTCSTAIVFTTTRALPFECFNDLFVCSKRVSFWPYFIPVNTSIFSSFFDIFFPQLLESPNFWRQVHVLLEYFIILLIKY